MFFINCSEEKKLSNDNDANKNKNDVSKKTNSADKQKNSAKNTQSKKKDTLEKEKQELKEDILKFNRDTNIFFTSIDFFNILLYLYYIQTWKIMIIFETPPFYRSLKFDMRESYRSFLINIDDQIIEFIISLKRETLSVVLNKLFNLISIKFFKTSIMKDFIAKNYISEEENIKYISYIYEELLKLEVVEYILFYYTEKKNTILLNSLQYNQKKFKKMLEDKKEQQQMEEGEKIQNLENLNNINENESQDIKTEDPVIPIEFMLNTIFYLMEKFENK
jgi:hypothetical protein